MTSVFIIFETPPPSDRPRDYRLYEPRITPRDNRPRHERRERGEEDLWKRVNKLFAVQFFTGLGVIFRAEGMTLEDNTLFYFKNGENIFFASEILLLR